MADDFSLRARRARVAQGFSEVLTDPLAVDRLSSLIVDTPSEIGESQ